jgi:DNA-binding GntR family transcriptional regulator
MSQLAKPSAAEAAYQHIRRRIIDGRLPAGAFLVEQELSAEIGVSRTPVRDALHRLESEGLVASEGNKRASVRAFSEAEVEECFELRALFESYAAARAATRITPAGLAELKRLAAEMDLVVAQGGPGAAPRFSDLNDAFHGVILDHAGSPRLRALLNPIMQVQLVLMKRFQHTIEAHLARSCWHHRELIAAFEAKDPAWAETQMRTHMLSAKNPGAGATASP